MCGALTSGVLGSHLLGTTSTEACTPGVCGGEGGEQPGGEQAQWASCPKTRRGVNPTCREGAVVTCR